MVAVQTPLLVGGHQPLPHSRRLVFHQFKQDESETSPGPITTHQPYDNDNKVANVDGSLWEHPEL